MKKIFTSISALAMLFVTAFTGSAQNQPQLTNAEKSAMVKEIIPAIFDQVKTISGVDFMALTNPTIEDIVSSPLFFQQGLTTRAAAPKTINIIPDSMIVDLSSIKMEGMPANIGALMKRVKLTFSEPKDFSFAAGKQPVNVKIPHKIVASIDLLGELLTISFTSGDKGVILPYSSFQAKLTLSSTLASLGQIAGDKFPLKEGNLLSIEETKSSNGAQLGYSIVMEAALRSMMTDLAQMPNFLITLDMTKLMTASTIQASLFAKPLQAPAASIPMGDATVYANLKSTTGMPVDSIIVTSYGVDAKVNGFKKLTPSISVKGANMLLTTTDSISATANGVWAPNAQQIITMPASLSTTFGDMMSSIVSGVISNLKSDMNQSFQIQIDSVLYTSDAKLDTNTVMIIDVVTKIEAVSLKESNLITTIDIKMPAETKADNAAMESVMNIKATIPTTSHNVKIEFTPAGRTEPMATAYLQSDALDITTSNETSPALEDVKVYVQEGGIYIENSDKATFAVISMNGAKIANGTIAGANEYIALPSLAKDEIYIIRITKGNVSKSFKVKAK